jgi:hypothetical protein
MLKRTLIFLFLAFGLNVQADQQAILSKAEAEKTVAFLEDHVEIILYCGCCSNDTYTKLALTKVSYECESSNWCRVRVQGVDVETQSELSKTIDLAYAWVNIDGVAKNLAWEVGLNADPCTPNFDWETFESIREVSEDVFDKNDAEAFQLSFKKLKKLLESETGFTLETFESNKQFVVEEVTLTSKPTMNSVVVSQIGGDFEHRYTIQQNRGSN